MFLVIIFKFTRVRKVAFCRSARMLSSNVDDTFVFSLWSLKFVCVILMQSGSDEHLVNIFSVRRTSHVWRRLDDITTNNRAFGNSVVLFVDERWKIFGVRQRSNSLKSHLHYLIFEDCRRITHAWSRLHRRPVGAATAAPFDVMTAIILNGNGELKLWFARCEKKRKPRRY